MSVASALVAVVFGFLVGWGLGRYERRAGVVALVTGTVAGVVTLAFQLGSDPVERGGSLVLGCGVGLLGLFLRRPP